MQIQPTSSVLLQKTTQAADTSKENAKLKKACHDFEGIIMQQMLTSMRKSIPKDGLLKDGYAQEMYQSMYDESLAQEMSKGKGTGLADTLYHQLSGLVKSR